MTRLGVNVDHVATLREARRINEPDPVAAAAIAELAGADSIIVHLREDRRHIKDRDLKLLKETIKTRLNLEMASTQEILSIALNIRPDIATIVPERREEVTTEGGLNVILNHDNLKSHIRLLKDAGIRVSLFIDPDLDQIKASHKLGADSVEIHTGKFCDAKNKEEDIEFDKILNSVKLASKLKMGVCAGHGINYVKIKRLREIEEIEEFNIGHSIISRAVFIGLYNAVREMIRLIKGEL
jgi:pyridoxine 5-phosphate synthase